MPLPFFAAFLLWPLPGLFLSLMSAANTITVTPPDPLTGVAGSTYDFVIQPDGPLVVADSPAAGNALAFTDTGLTPETDYSYLLEAVDANGRLWRSPSVVTIRTTPTRPAGITAEIDTFLHPMYTAASPGGARAADGGTVGSIAGTNVNVTHGQSDPILRTVSPLGGPGLEFANSSTNLLIASGQLGGGAYTATGQDYTLTLMICHATGGELGAFRSILTGGEVTAVTGVRAITTDAATNPIFRGLSASGIAPVLSYGVKTFTIRYHASTHIADFYMNGVPIYTVTVTPETSGTLLNYYLGVPNGGGLFSLNGWFYNLTERMGTALSDSEIVQEVRFLRDRHFKTGKVVCEGANSNGATNFSTPWVSRLRDALYADTAWGNPAGTKPVHLSAAAVPSITWDGMNTGAAIPLAVGMSLSTGRIPAPRHESLFLGSEWTNQLHINSGTLAQTAMENWAAAALLAGYTDVMITSAAPANPTFIDPTNVEPTKIAALNTRLEAIFTLPVFGVPHLYERSSPTASNARYCIMLHQVAPISDASLWSNTTYFNAADGIHWLNPMQIAVTNVVYPALLWWLNK